MIGDLAALGDFTGGALRWSETAGLKQVVRTADVDEDIALSFLASDYGDRTDRKVA